MTPPEPLVNDVMLRKIIVDGDNEALIEAAQKVGRFLGDPQNRDHITTSQIRGIFGTVRRIEMDWLLAKPSETAATNDKDEAVRRAKRELALLKPRIAYQAEREKKKGRGVSELSNVLIPAITLIENQARRFRNFVDFFEAILAYHRASGGSNN